MSPRLPGGPLSSKVKGLSGVPRIISEYYLANGLPGEVLSTRETESLRDGSIFISILFRDHPYRHRWTDSNVATRWDKIRIEGWTLQVIPL